MFSGRYFWKIPEFSTNGYSAHAQKWHQNCARAKSTQDRWCEPLAENLARVAVLPRTARYRQRLPFRSNSRARPEHHREGDQSGRYYSSCGYRHFCSASANPARQLLKARLGRIVKAYVSWMARHPCNPQCLACIKWGCEPPAKNHKPRESRCKSARANFTRATCGIAHACDYPTVAPASYS